MQLPFNSYSDIFYHFSQGLSRGLVSNLRMMKRCTSPEHLLEFHRYKFYYGMKVDHYFASVIGTRRKNLILLRHQSGNSLTIKSCLITRRLSTPDPDNECFPPGGSWPRPEPGSLKTYSDASCVSRLESDSEAKRILSHLSRGINQASLGQV